MGLVSRVMSWFRSEQRSITLADFPMLNLNGPIAAGMTVNERTAHEYTPFRNGVVLIAGDVGKIPRHPYELTPDGMRKRLDGSYLDRLLRQPNPYINDLDLWSTPVMHALVWGDGYLEIEFDNALRPIALWPIMPDQMTPVMDGPRLRYRYNPRQDLLDAEDVIHIKGPSFTGLKGDSPVMLARQALGLGLAMERFGASFFGNGAWPGFILEHPGQLSTEAQQRLVKQTDDIHRGPDKAHKTFIAEEGMKATKLSTDAKDSQLTDQRDFQVVEAARTLNLPPHKLKHKMGERPGNNLTESELDYLSGTLDPWLTRIEQECNLKLIPKARRGQWYIEHDRNAYLRMTPEAKATNYKAYFEMGVLTADQIAKKENLPKPEPPPPPAAVPGQPPPPVDEPIKLPASNTRMATAQRALVVETMGRFVRIEAERVRRQSKKGAQGLDAWLDTFYGAELPVLRGYLMGPVRIAMAAAGVDGDAGKVAGELAEGYVCRSKEELLALPARNLEEAADRLMAIWETTRPIDLAERLLSADLQERRR